MRILSHADLKAKGIPFSKVWIMQLAKDGRFPAPIRLSEQRYGFVEAEVDKWIRDRIVARNRTAA